MKLTNTILVLALTSGTVWAQNGPVIIQGAKATANAAQQKQNANVKTAVAAMPAQTAKPATAQASKVPVAKSVAVAKSAAVAVKPAVVQATKAPAAKPSALPVKVNVNQAVAKPSKASTSKSSTPVQPKVVARTPVAVKPVVAVKTVGAPKKVAIKKAETKTAESKPNAKDVAKEKANVSVEKAPEPPKEEKVTKTISANGRRDPFVSPVISQSAVGSGCSSGKRCLAVDQISLKGVVRSETGMIAVVVNAIDKAYFLRENDPVFDGYVLKITGDSIVFKETVQDKLGKPFTKEVTKKISAPAV